LKFLGRWKFDELKQRLVLTTEEKRVITFVLVAFFLGLGTQWYREAHPQPAPYIDPKRPWRKDATLSPSAPKRSPRRSRKQTSPTVAPSGTKTMSIVASPTPGR